jgi:hypothetical protein
MTSLLPHVVDNAVRSRSDFSASASFGVVALALLMALLVERELVRVAGWDRPRLMLLGAIAFPLMIGVGLTVVIRVVDLA